MFQWHTPHWSRTGLIFRPGPARSDYIPLINRNFYAWPRVACGGPAVHTSSMYWLADNKFGDVWLLAVAVVEDTRGADLACDDVTPETNEQECSLSKTNVRARCPNSKPVRKSKRRSTVNMRRNRKNQRQKVSAKNESEMDHLPNGDLLPDPSLSISDEVVEDRTSSEKLIDPAVRSYVCEACGRSFKKKERLMLHERTHTGERPYECETCGRRFSLAGNLRRHLPLHSGQKPFMCELCGRTFIRRAYLEDHLAVHVTAHPYACSLCPKRFNSGGQLRLHFRYVHDRSSTAAANRKWYPCEVCNKNFSSKGNLRTHLRTHTGERPFVCACGKAYAQRIQLVQHSRLHSDERPFNCETCGRAFRFRSSYLIHNRTHTGERPHVCEHCGKSYTNKAGLRTHAARVHAGKSDAVTASQPMLTVLM